MAIIGNGAQSEFQVVAFYGMVGIREVRLYDTDSEATTKLVRNLTRLQLAQSFAHSLQQHRRGCARRRHRHHLTADKRNATILTPSMIEPGMHLNAVGGDCPGKTELHPDILRSPAARIVVEFEPQARIEGEIQQLGGAVSSERTRAGLIESWPGSIERWRGHDFRFGGIRAQRLLIAALSCKN